MPHRFIHPPTHPPTHLPNEEFTHGFVFGGKVSKGSGQLDVDSRAGRAKDPVLQVPKIEPRLLEEVGGIGEGRRRLDLGEDGSEGWGGGEEVGEGGGEGGRGEEEGGGGGGGGREVFDPEVGGDEGVGEGEGEGGVGGGGGGPGLEEGGVEFGAGEVHPKPRLFLNG